MPPKNRRRTRSSDVAAGDPAPAPAVAEAPAAPAAATPAVQVATPPVRVATPAVQAAAHGAIQTLMECGLSQMASMTPSGSQMTPSSDAAVADTPPSMSPDQAQKVDRVAELADEENRRFQKAHPNWAALVTKPEFARHSALRGDVKDKKLSVLQCSLCKKRPLRLTYFSTTAKFLQHVATWHPEVNAPAAATTSPPPTQPLQETLSIQPLQAQPLSALESLQKSFAHFFARADTPDHIVDLFRQTFGGYISNRLLPASQQLQLPPNFPVTQRCGAM